MQWGREQGLALGRVDEWLRSDQQLFRLFGYAGTGKTTLARHFAEGVEGNVLFAAYTGKAAHVLQTKGCEGATTIHSLIYHSKDKGRAQLREMELQLAELMMELKGDGLSDEERDRHSGVIKLRGLILEERTSLARPSFTLNHDSPVKNAALVVIDECSMVDGTMGADLLSFGTKVLVLGDPAQLPPVGGAGFFTEGVRPDVMLEDIHRQASDNPIIAMASRVRQQSRLEVGAYGRSSVIERAELRPDAVMQAGQLLVGRNATRHASNRRIRALRGFEDTGFPASGDKVVCLRNNHDLGLLNGMLWTVDSASPIGSDLLSLVVRSEDDESKVVECEAHAQYFRGEGEKLGWWERKDAQEFDFGYALTCHKAQGSQWNDVMILDESYCFRQDRWRWLYTAITRAAEQVTVVQM
jgi:exodeoxyribonuclease-5